MSSTPSVGSSLRVWGEPRFTLHRLPPGSPRRGIPPPSSHRWQAQRRRRNMHTAAFRYSDIRFPQLSLVTRPRGERGSVAPNTLTRSFEICGPTSSTFTLSLRVWGSMKSALREDRLPESLRPIIWPVLDLFVREEPSCDGAIRPATAFAA